MKSGQSSWDVESDTRDAMSELIRQTITKFPTDTETLVIMSDLDEIPSLHTVGLLKACEFGERIHLQLRNFLYRYVIS